MNKLDQLINVLCPEGVEYVELGKIASITRGGNFQKKDFTEKGKPCIHYGQIYTKYGLFAKDTISFINEKVFQKQKKAVQNDIVMAVTSENVEDVCKCVAWLGEEEVAISGHTAIIHHNQNAKYLVYYFHSSMFLIHKVKLAHGTKVIEVKPDSLKNIKIPLPPLPVQEEIVRILDNLTELTTELTAELTSELTARKQQYEYYRDSLLTFGDEVERKTLNQISENLDAKRKPVTKSSRQQGEYPYYGASGIVDYVNDYIFDGDYLLISEDGANLIARTTPIAFSACGKIWVNNHAHVVQFTDYPSRRFVEIYLNSIDLNKYVSTAAQPKLTQENLNKIPIPYPDYTIREQIVETLDRFDKLWNGITECLPDEIRARGQQYEYYRDKLLTFKEKEVCADE